MNDAFEDGFIRERLRSFDRVGFGVAMRTIELNLVFDRYELAKRAFQNFLVRSRRTPLAIDARVAECLPARLAERLHKEGYERMQSLDSVSDETLLALSDVGRHGVQLIREALAALHEGRLLYPGDEEGDLGPEWDIDFDSMKKEVSEQMTTTERTEISLADAIGVIENAGPEAVAEIDKKIASLTSKISQLKRMRKLLGGADPKPAGAIPDWSELEEKIYQFVKVQGDSTALAISANCGDCGHTKVGKVVARSKRLVRRGRLITLA